MARTRFIWHIFPPFLAVVLLTLGLVWYIASHEVEDALLRQTEADLAGRARMLRALAAHPELHDSPALLQERSEALGLDSDARITIIEPDGTVVVDSDEPPARMDNHASRPEVAAALEGRLGRAIRHSDTIATRMMYVALPEKDEPGSRVYRVALPLTAIEETLDAIHRRLGLAIVGVSLFAALLSWIVSRRIMRPLAEVKAGADRFARGDLARPLAVPDTEEFAGLADAMNEMAAQLADRIEAVEKQRNEMEAVFSSMIESVLAVDTELRIISINQAAIALLGVQPSAVKGRPILEAIGNRALQRFAHDALRSHGLLETELTVDHQDAILLKAQGTVLRDGAGAAMGAVIVLHDITRLRRLEEMRQDFVANVSHELKTPITSIKGFVETLLDEPDPSPENTRHFLQIIEKQANRLDAIIEDLLSLSRLEQTQNASALQTESAPVLPIVEAAAELCQHQAELRGIRIQIECPEDLAAPVNPPLLEQGLVNLINNAVKYSDEGQTVFVRAFPENAQLVLEVEDEGAGIPANDLERIFERFYRVDRARSRELGGTGLGLSIVKHIAQAHRGNVTVASALGHGSTFTMRVPVR